MNVFLNLNLEHSLAWIHYKPSRIEQGLLDRSEAIKSSFNLPLHQKINLRGEKEQSYAFNGNTNALKRLCNGTHHKGCQIFTKYN